MSLRAKVVQKAFGCIDMIESLLPCFLTPDALKELSRAHFSAGSVHWKTEASSGLFPEEERIVDSLGLKAGRALCLGSGGGREAFALERRGLVVLGVEQIEELVAHSRRYAEENGLKARFHRSSIEDLSIDEADFDLITIANIAYSNLPSRRSRVSALRRCRTLVSRDGRCVISFAMRVPQPAEKRRQGILRVLGLLGGNPHRELGDRLFGDGNFVHFFPSLDAVGREVREAGFSSVAYDAKAGQNCFAIAAP